MVIRISDLLKQSPTHTGRSSFAIRASQNLRMSQEAIVKDLGLLALTIFVVTGMSAKAQVSFFEESPAYDNCILQHLAGAKSDYASQLISQICSEKYEDTGLMSDDERAYNRCLLDHLRGVESNNAAFQIQGACKRRHLNFP